MEKYYISEENWQKIYEILKRQKGVRVKNKARTRQFFEGVYFIMRTGSQW